MKKNKVSIIVPVYNIEECVGGCIESIIRQNYKNIEVILVDDGSIDNSLQICKKYADLDSRIVIYEKENGGLSDARNYGLDRCSGDYVLFIDGDDMISEDCVSVLMTDMNKNDADISTVLFSRFFEGEKPIETTKKALVMDSKKALRWLLYQHNCTTCAWGKMYRKELFEGIRYPFGKICEDLPTTYKLFMRAKKVTINASRKYFYLQRKNSIIHSTFNAKRAEALDFAREETIDISKKIEKLTNAARHRELIEAIYVLESMDGDYSNNKKYVHRAMKVIRENKRYYINADMPILCIAKQIYKLPKYWRIINEAKNY